MDTFSFKRKAIQRINDPKIDALKRGLVKLLTYVTHKVSFDAVKFNFQRWLNPSSGVSKPMIENVTVYRSQGIHGSKTSIEQRILKVATMIAVGI